MGIVLEADGGRGRPLGMFLGDALPGDAPEPNLLALTQLEDDGAMAIGIGDDGLPHPFVQSRFADDQVPGVDGHGILGTFGVEGENDAAILAELIASDTFAGVE